MIISDENRFAFVHIPKCAGTSVRRQLAAHDSTGGAFSGGLVSLDGGEQVDTAHIPLGLLKAHFPEAFEKVAAYESFAILRDPFQRFPASLFQRLQMYGDVDIASLTQDDMRAAAQEIMTVLQAHGPEALLPHDFIHFQPQSTYVEHDGQRILSKLYDIGNMGAFFAAASRQLGGALKDPESLQSKKTNQSRVYRSATAEGLVSRLPAGLRYPLLALVPSNLKNVIRGLAFEPKNKRLNDVMQDPEVASFIETFYAKDIVLYRQACQGCLTEGSQ